MTFRRKPQCFVVDSVHPLPFLSLSLLFFQKPWHMRKLAKQVRAKSRSEMEGRRVRDEKKEKGNSEGADGERGRGKGGGGLRHTPLQCSVGQTPGEEQLYSCRSLRELVSRAYRGAQGRLVFSRTRTHAQPRTPTHPRPHTPTHFPLSDNSNPSFSAILNTRTDTHTPPWANYPFGRYCTAQSVHGICSAHLEQLLHHGFYLYVYKKVTTLDGKWRVSHRHENKNTSVQSLGLSGLRSHVRSHII